LILCDIGNSTFHFFIDGKHKKYFLDEKLPKFDDEVYFISVNKSATKKLKESNPQSKSIKKLMKLETSYVGLGIDRAIASYFETDAIIVDAGSAITVDIMDKGKHLGGFILPGFRAFMKTYQKDSFHFTTGVLGQKYIDGMMNCKLLIYR
jgi:type III pantothenate kinase